jgi:putative transposase
VLDDLIARGLRTAEFLITDGAAGLERALTTLWPDVPAQCCTAHTTRTQSPGRLGRNRVAGLRRAQ